MRWWEVGRHWGSSAEERAQAFPCDALIPDPGDAYTRAVTVRADPARAFRWLCQLRVAPYSYDWIDNLGRRSPRELTPGLEELAVGQPVMRIFDLVSFEPGRHLTLRLRRPGVFPPLAVSYVVVPTRAGECRIVVKLVVRLRAGLRDRIARPLLPWLDWIMMRRQLLNLRRLAERTAASGYASASGRRGQSWARLLGRAEGGDRVYEHRRARPLSRRRFYRRLAAHAAAAAALLGASLLAGIWGYEHFEALDWREAFLNAAMLLGGMGPVDAPQTKGGKLFAGCYALYAGLVFIVTAGLLLAPAVHRLLHRFHWESERSP